ncbi:hypothetical protein Q8A67_024690 [Cirrhinus molitorella]|uniref:Uncharacterized protein n=1 Tax=Cirrhinus molitorella TaxID=172907 RepID=A0AA88P403_9TELE|nr:hypothetical protein Q8A67_024690 [Cirrhinus molitorella]
MDLPRNPSSQLTISIMSRVVRSSRHTPDDQGRNTGPPGPGHVTNPCHVTSAADGMGTSSGSWHQCHFS